ncbi:tryptophan-rich sensory protein [Histidinibacterium aquaticum]|uniref:Tryptophan-rich sensory protein n=1 Tax=Histidinibacterium aquaticum TaxID=2613962 RepID=A0A5J5GP25_9RHOB|nr:tryptophan-rich sensory protein [Histidinibacterium aquaticum]KAA9009284.1 hypothetical protein F3S47_08530 [Histidinibacterium aquaticum]
MRSTLLAWATLILSVTFAAAPLFSSFAGFDGAQLPEPQDSPPIEPAGYAFSIWILIYIWLVLSAAFGLRTRRDDPAWTAPRAWLSLSLLIGTPWLWVANQSAIWATVMIVAMAVTAVMALKAAPWFDRWMLRVPVGIYAGWLTAASFVSLGSTLAGYGILGPVPVAFIGLASAVGVAAFVQDWLGTAPEYGLTVVWALVAIMVQNGEAQLALTILAAVGILIVGFLAWRNRHRPPIEA